MVENRKLTTPPGRSPFRHLAWMAGLAGCAMASPAQPQPVAGTPAEDVMVIRITSGRLAAPSEPAGAVSRVEPAPTSPGPAATVGDLLDRVPGVYAGSRFNGAQDLRLSVRGFGSRGNFGIRGIRIFLDGLPLTLPDGQSAVDEIDPAAIAGATVRRGPSSALYGAAAGGVINLESPPLFTPRGNHAGVGLGAWGRFDARVGGNRVGARHALDAGVSSRGSDGYRDHANQLHHRLSLRYGYRPDAARRLELSLTALDSPFARDPGGLTAAERAADRRGASPLHSGFDAGEAVTQQRLGLRWHDELGDGRRLLLGGYWLERDFANRLPFSATDLDRRVAGLTVELEREGELGLGPWRWVAGADLDLQDDLRRRFTNDAGTRGDITARQRERVGALGLFSQWTLTPAPRLDLGLGLRGDLVAVDFDDRFPADGDGSGDRTFRELSPTLGVTWRAGAHTRLFGRLGTAFEIPTTTELANPTGAGGFNPALQPQRAVGVEGGIQWDDGWGSRATLALYHTLIRDQLVPRPIPNQPGRFFFVNAASSRYTGLELELERLLLPGLQARLAVTAARLRFDEFTDAAGRDLDGNRVPGIPERQLTAALDYAGAGGWRGRLDFRWAGSRHADDANTVAVDDFQVWDAAATRHVPLGGGRLALTLGVDNLLDARYEDNLRINAAGGRYFEPAPERSLYLQLELMHP